MLTARHVHASRSALIVAALLGGIWMQAAAPSASACSCVEPQPMATYAADPRAAVLTGVPGRLQARGLPIQVTGWFKGPAAAAVVWLSAGSFGNEGAACQRVPPTPGQELILVLYMPEDGSDPSGSICTPMALVAGDQGTAMLADAIATFGAPTTVLGQPMTSAEPLDVVADLVPALAVVVAGAATLALVIAGLTLASRRRRGDPTDPPTAGA